MTVTLEMVLCLTHHSYKKNQHRNSSFGQNLANPNTRRVIKTLLFGSGRRRSGQDALVRGKRFCSGNRRDGSDHQRCSSGQNALFGAVCSEATNILM